MDWKDGFRKLADAGVEMFQKLNPPKEFTLKYTFTDVSKIGDGENIYSPTKYHFDIPWSIRILHKNDHINVYLYCKTNQPGTQWSIKCAFQMEIIHPSGNSERIEYEYKEKKPAVGWNQFMKWEEMKKEYLVGDQLTVAVHVIINKMTGIE